jgi:hypothetical protein
MDQWTGQTYYDRPQLKPAPFKKSLVGGYVFLAGLSGAAQLLATLLDLTRGKAAAHEVRAATRAAGTRAGQPAADRGPAHA